MPTYEVRLEAQDDSGHFRVGRVNTESEQEAARVFEMLELRKVLYEMPAGEQAQACKAAGAKTLDEVVSPPRDGSDRSDWRALDGATRARVAAHHQQEPYKVVSVTEVKK